MPAFSRAAGSCSANGPQITAITARPSANAGEGRQQGHDEHDRGGLAEQAEGDPTELPGAVPAGPGREQDGGAEEDQRVVDMTLDRELEPRHGDGGAPRHGGDDRERQAHAPGARECEQRRHDADEGRHSEVVDMGRQRRERDRQWPHLRQGVPCVGVEGGGRQQRVGGSPAEHEVVVHDVEPGRGEDHGGGAQRDAPRDHGVALVPATGEATSGPAGARGRTERVCGPAPGATGPQASTTTGMIIGRRR